MRASSGLILVLVGLFTLYLAATGRLNAVITALLTASKSTPKQDGTVPQSGRSIGVGWQGFAPNAFLPNLDTMAPFAIGYNSWNDGFTRDFAAWENAAKR